MQRVQRKPCHAFSGPDATAPPAPPPSQAGSAPVNATFSISGGTVTVSCQGSTISLVSASPSNGYTLSVRNSGPIDVDVDFNGQPNGSAVQATCRNGQPVRITDE